MIERTGTRMTIFVLLIIGLVFLLLTGIIIACDNRRRKYKKKTLRLHWRVLGILFTIITFVSLGRFVYYVINFDGEECSDRKILLRTTLDLTEVTIPSGDATLDKTLKNNYEETIQKIDAKDEEQKIEYVDALMSKKKIPLKKIHEVKYSKDLTANQVQMVEYLVISKDGQFTMPEVYYYIIFGEELLEKQEEAKGKNSKTKKENTKKNSSKKNKKEKKVSKEEHGSHSS